MLDSIDLQEACNLVDFQIKDWCIYRTQRLSHSAGYWKKSKLPWNKVYRANIGPTRGQQDPCGPHKNAKRHTAHTIVSWPNPKQWVIVRTSDLMMMIRQSIYILSIMLAPCYLPYLTSIYEMTCIIPTHGRRGPVYLTSQCCCYRRSSDATIQKHQRRWYWSGSRGICWF